MVFIRCPALPDVIVICIDAHELVFVKKVALLPLISILRVVVGFVLLFVLIIISKLDLRIVVFELHIVSCAV